MNTGPILKLMAGERDGGRRLSGITCVRAPRLLRPSGAFFRLAFGALLVIPASAQGAELVSNIGQDNSSTIVLATNEMAMGFETGPTPGGYTLGSIEVEFVTASDVALQSVTATLWTADEDDSDIPGSSIATLSNPASLSEEGASTSTDATLSALSLGTGVTLDPAFASATTDYRAWVANPVDSVTVTATKNDEAATVAIAGDDDAATPGTATLSLDPGRNTVKVTVTAEDGNTTEAYTVTLVREAAAPSAHPALLLNALMTVGERDGFPGYNALLSPTIGAITGADFEVDSTRYELGLLGEFGATAPTHYNPETVVACFAASANPPDAVRNALVVLISGKTFRFDASTAITTSDCYEWPRAAGGLGWSYGEIVAVALELDVTPPALSSVAVTSMPTAMGDTYGVGEKIRFTVTFNGPVRVTGAPHFEFSLGPSGSDVDKEAALESGDGTTALVFAYTVLAADMDDNGIRVRDHTRTIKLDAGETIRDLVSNTADAVLVHIGLGTLGGHKVDGSLSPPPPPPPPTQVPANWGLIPSGLSEGDAFRLLIVTSTRQNAEDTAIADYNSVVRGDVSSTGHADIRSYSAGFKILGCTRTTSAIANTYTGSTDTAAAIYWLNGAKVADNYADLYDGNWDSNRPKYPGGTNAPVSGAESRVFTGCLESGASSGSNYLGADRVNQGYPASAGFEIDALPTAKTDLRRFFGLSGIFRVGAAAPTVSSVAVTSTPTAESDTYGVGELIRFTVTFTDEVEVSASRPHFEFSLDGTDTRAAYERGSGTTALVFVYTVLAADMDDNGIWIGNQTRTIKLDDGEYIRAVDDQVSAFLNHAGPGRQSEHKVDGSLTPTGHSNAIGAPAISGTARVGETLTAAIGNIADADGLPVNFPGDYSFQWIREDSDGSNAVDIPGATLSTYALVAADEGKKIKVRVSFQDDDGNDEELTSAAYPASKAVAEIYSAVMGAGNPSPGYVGFSSGQAGSLNPNSFTDDGTGYTIVYLAVLRGELILEFNKEPPSGWTLHVGDAAFPFDDASRIRGNRELHWANSGLTWSDGDTVNVRLTTLPAMSTNTPATGAPAITGTAQVNKTLTADMNDIADTDGPPDTFPDDYTFQWIRVDADGESNREEISGAIARTYALVAADEGKKIKVRVSFTDKASNGEARTSDAYPSGMETVAEACEVLWCATLTVGNLSTLYGYSDVPPVDIGSLSPDSFTRGTAVVAVPYVAYNSGTGGQLSLQIRRISGTTPADGLLGSEELALTLGSETFTFTAGLGSQLVFAFDAAGLSWDDGDTVEVSLAIANRPATGVPTISGAAQVGQTLTAARGSIDDTDGPPDTFPDDYTFQWIRVDADGESNREEISGAIARTYALIAADEGKKIKVRVSFTDKASNGEALTGAAYPSGMETVAEACEVLWCATLTVGNLSTLYGYSDLPPVDIGSLSPDSFTRGTAVVAVPYVAYNSGTGGQLSLQIRRISGTTPADGLLGSEELALTLGSETFTFTAGLGSQLVFAFDAAGLSWNEGDRVKVSLAVAAANNPATGVPAISGTARAGETLTAAKDTIADADGLPATFPDDYTLQWVRVDADGESNSVDIGTDSSTYMLVAADEGKKIKVEVSFQDNEGNGEARTSDAYPSGMETVAEACEVLWCATLTVGNLSTLYGYSDLPPVDIGSLSPDSFTRGTAVVGVPYVAYNSGTGGQLSLQIRRISGTTPADGLLGSEELALTLGSETFTFTAGLGSQLVFAFDAAGLSWNEGDRVKVSLAVAAANNPATGAPAISGTARAGETLTAAKDTIADADGLPATFPDDYTLQWVRVDADGESNSVDIGTDSSTYMLVAADEGKKIKVEVSFQDNEGNGEARTSAAYPSGMETVAEACEVLWCATLTVGNLSTLYGYSDLPPVDIGSLSPDSFTRGTAVVGVPYVAYNSGTGGQLSLQIRRISGTTPADGLLGSEELALTLGSETFTFTAGLGSQLVFAFDAAGLSWNEGDRVKVSLAVAAANNPATGAPAISGTARAGETLTAATTGIMDDDGLKSATYSYQWIREDSDGTNPTPISGATSSTYMLAAEDEGKRVKVKVTFTDDASNDEELTSAAYPSGEETVAPANNAPVITTTSPQSVPENTTAAVTLAATDADTGSTFTWSKNGGADAGKFNLTTAGVLTFAAAPDFEVPADSGGDNGYVVIVRVSDGTATDDLTLTVNVTDADEKPATPAAPGVTATAGSTTSLDVSWTAPNRNGGPAIAGYNLQYRAGTSGSFTNGPQNVTGTSVAITTGLSAATSYEVQVRALNGETPSDWSPSGTGSTGSPANNAPVITTTSPQSVPENTTAAVTLAATDADTGSTFTWSKNGGADAGKFNLTTAGVLTFAAAPDFEVPADSGGDNGYVVIVRVSDGTATDDLTLTVNVTDADEKPATPAAPGVTATAGSTTSLDVSWTAPNRNGGPAIAGYNLQYRAGTSGSFTNGPQNVTGTSVAITTGLSAATSYEVQVRALNGETPSDWSPSGTGSTGSPANNAPVITTTSPQSVPENTTAAVTLAATDADTGSTFTWSKNGGADAGKFNLTTAGVLTFAAAPDFEVPADSGGDNGYVVIVRVSDGTATDDLTLTVNVTDADEKPATPAAPGVTATAGSTTSLDVSWTAPNRNGGPAIAGYNLQYRAGTSGSFTNGPQNVTGTSVAITTGLSAATSYEVQVRALNGETPSDWSPSGTGSTGSPANNAPVITTTSPQSVPENTTAAVTLAATDADTGSTFTWSKNGGADAGKFNLTTAGVLTFAAAPDFEVPADSGGDNGYVVIVRVSDGTATDDLTLTVNVTDADEKPATPAAPGVTATAGSTTSLDVSWTAPNRNGGPAIAGYNLQYRAGTSGSFTNGPQNVTGTSVAITTGLSAATSYEVQVRALNGETPSDWSPSGTGSTGSPANNAPVITTTSPQSVPENTTAAVTLAATDADTGSTFTWSKNGGADAGKFNLTTAGVLTFAAAPDFEVPADSGGDNGYVVIVRVSDGTATDDLTLTVNVTDADEKPATPAAPGVTATAGSTTSLDVSWTAPNRNGGPAIAGYNLQYRAGTSGSFTNGPQNVTGTSVAITTGLSAATSYEVQVRALNGETPSDWSPSGTGSTGSPANNAPVITTTSPQSVPENTTAAVTLAATDADTGSTFTWSKNGGADAGKFNLTTAGVLTFAAAPDFEVPADSGGDNGYVVIVRVSDGTATDDLTLTVNVTDADEKPATPAAPGVTATAGSTTSLDVSWTAPNRNGGPAIAGYNLQYRAGTSGSFTNGPQNVTGTSVAITTGLSAATSYEVQVRALNGETPSDWSPSGTGSTGSPANNAPVITTTSPQSVPENTTAAVTLAATDADTGSTFTWSKNGGADAGKFNLTTAGVLTFAAAPDFEVPADSGGDNGYVVIVRVSDGTATDDLTLTVNVTDADEKPATPAAPGVTATAGSTTSLDVSWTAPNRNGGPAIAGYNLQYRAGTSGSFTNGPQNVTGTSVAITTGLSAATSYEVQVRALNGETPSDWSPSGTGSTGSPANNPASGAPTISGTARVGGALTAARGSIDDDDGLPSTFPDDYAFQWVREDSGGTNPMDIDGATSSTYTLDANDEGKRVKVKVTFTDGGSNDEALTSAAYPSIGTVDPANNAPAFTEGASATRSVAENTAAGANIGDPVEATDTDTGDTLTYTLRGTDAAAFAIVSTSGQLRTKAALNHETKSSHSVTVAVSDGNGGSDSITVTINVTDVDEQPATPAAPSVGSTPGTTTSLTVNWTAPDANGGPAIAGYDLQYRAGTSGNFMDGPQNVTGTSAAIAGLNADTSYLVRVRALNGETPSEWSAPGAGVTATAAGVTLGATSLDVGEGVSATYTVVLEAPPTGPVTVTPRVVGNTEVTVSGALTFTAMNWQDAQEVTVSADHDADDEDDTATVSHAVTGANYARVTAGDVEVTVLDDEGSFGTIDAHFTAVRGGADDVAGWGGPLPDNHFGEPFQLAVGFRRAGDYVLLTGRCQPLTWEQYQTLTVCARGPAPAQWLGPNGALRVTGATVRLIDTAYHRIRMELTPTAPARDVTVTVQPLPCPAAGAMCAGSNGLSKRLNLTVSGVTGPPEAPGNVTVEPIDYHEDGGNDLRVSFDLDPVGVDYLIQWQRAGKAWASPGEREGWRGQKRTGRDSDVIFDVVAGQAYDVRVRWENDRGPGPWTTVYNVGGTGQGSNRGAPEVERIERHGDQVWIFFDRDLDTGVARHNKLTPQFGVHYSESAPAGLPDTLAGHSVNLTEIVKTRHAGACTSNGQACRIVRLTLNPVTRGGTEYDGPADEETVSVSYWKSYYEPENLRAAGEWHSVPHVAEFSRVVADPVGTTPALSVADAEGREGTNPSIRFAVRLAPAATGEVTVRYYTSSGTATVRADYEETTGTLTFATGEWRKIVEVPIVDDEEKDSGETFFFHLFEASGAQIGDDRATGTILNREDEDDTAEDDTAEDDPVEDDPVEDDPVEDDPVEEEAIEKAPPPPALSVADASVDEKENDATLLDFAVTLNRAPSTTVTVDYATADGAGANPATAGQDYHSRSGTLTFTRGQQRRIVSIAVLDDSHDEGAETLTMTLSNASGATIADGKATGTINNSDPMPKGWLARFGRTASVHTVDAIRERLTGGPRRPEENHFTVGGRRVDQLLNEFRSAARGDDAKETGERAAPDRRLEDESTWDRMDRLKAESMGWWAAPGRAAPGGIGLAAGEFAGGAPRMGGPAPTGLSSSGASPSGSNDAGLASAGLPSAARAGLENLVSAGLSSAGLLSTARPFADLLSRGREDWRALLMGSSFDYSRTLEDGAGTANGLASWSAWGRAAETRFSGADGELSIDGAVATATVGADARWGRWLAGVAVSHSFGEGAYSHPTAAGGDVTSRLTSINPYANFTLNERLSLWGAVGYGVGDLSLQSKRAEDAIETGLESTLAAFGGRGVFSRRGGGFELAVVSDALFTNTVSDAATGLMGAEGAASRLRLMLEGSGSMALSNGGVLRPTLEAGLRYDGGDAETGAGLEVGGGVAYTAGRVSVEVNVRGLLAHEDAEYEEWGFSGSLKWQPNEDGRGWAMEAGSSWGDTASGVNALWSRQDASGIARGAGMDAARRFHAQLGYGLEGRRGRALWVPFVGAESSAGQQAYRMGVKLTSGANLEAGLELGRRTDARGVAEDAIQLQGSVRW